MYMHSLITLGAKSYHFSKNGGSVVKSITLRNFENIPKSSIVFLSFGEIDCRDKEVF